MMFLHCDKCGAFLDDFEGGESGAVYAPLCRDCLHEEYDKGYKAGKDVGYSEGRQEGYDRGYQDGQNDAGEY